MPYHHLHIIQNFASQRLMHHQQQNHRSSRSIIDPASPSPVANTASCHKTNFYAHTYTTYVRSCPFHLHPQKTYTFAREDGTVHRTSYTATAAIPATD
jgi:hypothetical protein